MRNSNLRVMVVVLVMAALYEIVQWPEIRVLYGDQDKYAHALTFFSVWWALYWALAWRPLALSLVSACLGGIVEVHQIFLPRFHASWADWAADLVGIALAVALFTWTSRRRGGMVGA